jgi:lysophospholipid acyltransferase
VTLFKTVYDIAGTVYTVLLINFIALPFVLLYLTEGIEVWRRVHYYGLWMVFGSLAFFYGGGTTFLMGIQAKRMRRANATTASPNRPSTTSVVPEKKLS